MVTGAQERKAAHLIGSREQKSKQTGTIRSRQISEDTALVTYFSQQRFVSHFSQPSNNAIRLCLSKTAICQLDQNLQNPIIPQSLSVNTQT